MVSLLMRRPDLDELPPAPTGVDLATTADAEGLAGLLDASFTTEEWDVARVHKELFDDSTVEAVYVIRERERIVSTASARLMPEDHPGAGYLHWVASDPQLRGRGLGRSVTIAVLHRFAADGLTATVLETDDERLPAIRLYLALGYVPQYPDSSHVDRWSLIFRALDADARSRIR